MRLDVKRVTPWKYLVWLLLATVTPLAIGQELNWDFTPRLSFSQVYSDNIRLSPSGEENSDFISQVNSGFDFKRVGARARARLGYNLQSVFYWQNTSDSSLFHQFFADGRLDVLPERFSVDARAGYTQRQLTRERVGGDNLSLDSNRGDVLTFRLSPVYRERFDDIANFQARYSYNRVDVQSGSVDGSNSERNDVQLSLSSGPQFSQFGWGLSFNWSQTSFEDGTSTTVQRLETLGRWSLTERLSLFGVVGYEEDDFDQDDGRSQPDDFTWRVGATFAPGERTFMEAFFGDRVFGTTYGASLRHRLRNSQVFLDYSEDITTINQFEIGQTIPRGVSQTVEEALIIDGEPVFFDFESPELRSGSFISRRLSAGYSGQRRKTSWSFRVFHEQRDFEISNRNEEAQSVAGNISWQMRPRTSLVANGSLQHSDADNFDGEQTLYFTRLGLLRQFGPRLSASVNYSFRNLEGRVGRDGYQENRVTAVVQKSF